MPKILIAGGGSGGHVAPAIASAEALSALGCNVTLAHSTRTIDHSMASQTPFERIEMKAKPFKTSPLGFLRFTKGFINTNKQMSKYIQKNRIDCVLGTGGFVAAPAIHAARKMGCPTVLLNLDDPPGKANALAVRWADKVLSTVNCQLQNMKLIAPPLRSCVIAQTKDIASYEKYQCDPQKLTLLITGASQGASTINVFIPELAKRNTTAFQDWQIVHIAGAGNVKKVENLWRKTSIKFKVIDFAHHMGALWSIADLAITRGGANTIAEIGFNAIPSIVMPYPYHKDDHQRINALSLERVGGVRIETDYKDTEANIQHCGATLLKLLNQHKERFQMHQALTSLPIENGAEVIARTCLGLI